MEPGRLHTPSGRPDGWSVLAASVSTAAWGMTVVAVVLLGWHGHAPRIPSLWVMDVVAAVVYGGVVLAMLPRTRHPAAWIMVLVALGGGFSALGTQLLVLEPQPYGDGREILSLVTYAVWLPGTYATLTVLPWLVGHRGRFARVAARVGVVLTATCVVTHVTSHPSSPLRVAWQPWVDTVTALQTWPDRACVVLSALGSAHLAREWWRSRGTDQTGFGWLAIGQSLITVAFVPVSWFVLGDRLLDLSGAGLILAQAFLPGALLVVVLRQQLWGVDLTVSRVTVWGLLSLAVVGGYVVVTWVAGLLLPDATGLARLLAVGLVVALAQPVRFWIQRRVDRLVYGPGADPVHLLGSWGAGLDSAADALRSGLRLGGIEVRDVDGRVRARSGHVAPTELELPLLVAGRPRGRLLVSAPTGERLDQRTRRAVEQSAGPLAVVLELDQVNEHLAATAGRLAEVRREERRTLRRDLDDGMGPALAQVGSGLATARRRLVDDPEGARVLLAGLEAEVEQRTEDVRSLARALLPGQLDDGDLPGALEVLADRFRATGLVVDTEVRVTDDLTPRRQVEVYHAAARALAAAARERGTTRVRLAVATGPSGDADVAVVGPARETSS